MTILELAKRCGDRAEAQYRSLSGTDVAEAEFHRLERLFWIDIWNGKAFAEAFTKFDTSCREHAKIMQAKVDSAPKIKRGPSSGHSVISYKWVSPEWAQQKLPHLKAMAGLPKGRFDFELQRIVAD